MERMADRYRAIRSDPNAVSRTMFRAEISAHGNWVHPGQGPATAAPDPDIRRADWKRPKRSNIGLRAGNR